MIKDPVKCRMLSGYPDARLGHLRAADQLSDRAQGHRAAALHPGPLHTDADIDHLVEALMGSATISSCSTGGRAAPA
jgi:5-aminolevulinate synthase